MSTPIVFEFDFHGSARLTVEEIWPDGDAPENPTTQDVRARLRKCTGGSVTARFIDDWNLADCIGITITGPGGSAEAP